MSGFLDNIPDINLPGGRSKRSPRSRTAKPKVKQAVINTGEDVRTIIWRVIKCPECGSTKVPVETTRRPIRYHVCSDCGCRFKSVEQ